MALNVCPAARVKAPLDLVWSYLCEPRNYANWLDATVVGISPDGPAVSEQRIFLRSNGLSLTMVVNDVNASAHQVALTTKFPFGIDVENHVSCASLDQDHCWVQYG